MQLRKIIKTDSYLELLRKEMSARWIKILNIKLGENKRCFTILGWETSSKPITYPRRIHKYNNVKMKKKIV